MHYGFSNLPVGKPVVFGLHLFNTCTGSMDSGKTSLIIKKKKKIFCRSKRSKLAFGVLGVVLSPWLEQNGESLLVGRAGNTRSLEGKSVLYPFFILSLISCLKTF